MPSTFTRLAAVLLLAAATQAQAQSILIDDFVGAFGSNRVYYDNFGPTPTSQLESTVAAAVPGGSRRLQLTADPQVQGSSGVTLSGDGALWGFSYRPGEQRLNFNLSYGTQAPMNLDLSGTAALHFDVYYSTPVSLVVYASTQTTPGDNPDASAVSITVPALFQQGLDIPLSAFSTNSSTGLPVNWADVDGLSFFVSSHGDKPAPGDGFWVTSLSTVPVPEPASALLLAAGLAALRVLRRSAA